MKSDKASIGFLLLGLCMVVCADYHEESYVGGYKDGGFLSPGLALSGLLALGGILAGGALLAQAGGARSDLQSSINSLNSGVSTLASNVAGNQAALTSAQNQLTTTTNQLDRACAAFAALGSLDTTGIAGGNFDAVNTLAGVLRDNNCA